MKDVYSALFEGLRFSNDDGYMRIEAPDGSIVCYVDPGDELTEILDYVIEWRIR